MSVNASRGAWSVPLLVIVFVFALVCILLGLPSASETAPLALGVGCLLMAVYAAAPLFVAKGRASYLLTAGTSTYVAVLCLLTAALTLVAALTGAGLGTILAVALVLLAAYLLPMVAVRPATQTIQAHSAMQAQSDALRAQTAARIDALIRAERDPGRLRALDRARDVTLSLTGESRPDLISYDSAIEHLVSSIERLCSTGSGPEEIDACVTELARVVAVRNESLKLRS